MKRSIQIVIDNTKVISMNRAKYNIPKHQRGNEYFFSVDEGATTNYRRVYNHKN